jgi:CubicO group peptidase (beta-lactamase class C family)
MLHAQSRGAHLEIGATDAEVTLDSLNSYLKATIVMRFGMSALRPFAGHDFRPTRRSTLLGGLAVTASLLGPRTAFAAPPDLLDDLVETGLRTFGTPGLSIAVIEDGQPVVSRGYGIRQLGSSYPVGEATAFPVASLSKAFTSAAMAVLVADGKLGWEDKVVDRLPGFQLFDPIATREMTIRDLLSHRSGLGLGEGDLMLFPPTDFTRAELVRKLRYLKPAGEFRYTAAYDNVLYLVAGELIAAVSGRPWESFVAERLLQPIGMRDSAPSLAILRGSNRSALHARIDGPIRGLGHLQVLPSSPSTDLTNPAGGIWASARDMVKWMALQLAGGVLPNGARLWSAESAQLMWSPLTVIDTNPGPVNPETEPHFVLGAMGWALLDYRGIPVVMHAGDMPGMCSRLMLVPSRKLGIFIALNSEDETLHEALAYSILDRRLGLPTSDYVAIGKQHDDARAARMLKRADQAKVVRPANAGKPALPLSNYAGTYRSDWYGDVVIATSGGGLGIDFTRTPAMKGALDPWDGETFITRFHDRDVENALVTFDHTADGRIAGASISAASPMADFSYDYQDLALHRVA